MVNDRELIDNYILWERVFEIFITDKDYIGFARFAKKVKTAIDSLRVILKNDDKTETGISPHETPKSLRRHLTATLNCVLSLLWGDKADDIIIAAEEALLLRQAYINTRMSNKYVMAVPSEVIRCLSDSDAETTVNFTDFSESFKHICYGQAVDW